MFSTGSNFQPHNIVQPSRMDQFLYLVELHFNIVDFSMNVSEDSLQIHNTIMTTRERSTALILIYLISLSALTVRTN